MFGIHSLPLFIVSCIMLNLTPGQDTMYIIGRSLAQGRKAGVLSVMGVMTGVLAHTLLAGFGLSAVLASSAIAFSVVKYAGAVYLIWIGIGYLRSPNPGADTFEVGPLEDLKPGGIFRQGMLTNVLNPKVSLFFLSFLPQFVDPGTQLVFIPFLLLGMIFFTTGSIWCLVLVYGATWVTGRLRCRALLGGIIKKASGALFVGLGIKLAISRGFKAMQYNLVVSTNEGVVKLLKRHGFDIIGTLPKAYRHSRLGFVDAFVMYMQLET